MAAKSRDTDTIWEEGFELASHAAQVCYRNGATRVWLFGSFGRKRLPDRISDIDLAVEGLPSLSVVRQSLKALNSHSKRHFDIVDTAKMDPCMRASFLRGRRLIPNRESLFSERLPSQWEARPTGGPLANARHDAVVKALRFFELDNIVDLGCGRGHLVVRLASEGYAFVTGVDLSGATIRRANLRVLRALPSEQIRRVMLFQGNAAINGPLFHGYDAAIAMELIEHLDRHRLAGFESNVFHFIRPKVVLITTPNADYNALFCMKSKYRHPDHKFEFTRAEFEQWCMGISTSSGYDVEFNEIGTSYKGFGAPTQMAVFAR